MKIAQYFPSGQFVVIASSIAVAGGLIFGAQYVTQKPSFSGELATATTATQTQSGAEWQQTLREIQAQSTAQLPPVPNPNAVSELLRAAQGSNLTETIGKTLFINVVNANAHGLGADIPTQDSLIAGAISQINQARSPSIYTQSDLTEVISSPSTLHTYGNIFMQVLLNHPTASARNTLIAIGQATDNNDPSYLASFKDMGKEYKAISSDLAKITVPQTLAPVHLQIVNNYSQIADTYPSMQAVIDDPLRGLAALQLYQSLTQETARLLTSIAEQFSKNGILFNKDEPGNTWSLLVLQTQ